MKGSIQNTLPDLGVSCFHMPYGTFSHLHYKMNGYTVRGSNSTIYILPPFSKGVTIKEKNLLL